MALFEIIATSGALYAGVKLSQRRSKKSLVDILRSEKVKKSQREKERGQQKIPLGGIFLQKPSEKLAQIMQNGRQKYRPSFDTLSFDTLRVRNRNRYQQNPLIETISSQPPKKEPVVLARKKSTEEIVNRNIIVTGTTLAILSVGYWLPFSAQLLITLPSVYFVSGRMLGRLYRKLKQGVFAYEILKLLTIGGMLVYGYFFLSVLAGFVFSLAEKSLTKVLDDTHSQLIDVFQTVPALVWVISDGVEVQMPISEVMAGDVVVVHAGEVIPVDGIVTEGMAQVDQHILTGEAQPVDKDVGDIVFASTTLLSGNIFIRVEQAGEMTTVAKIGNILNNTVDFKTTTELRAETIADNSVLPTLLASGLAFSMLGSPAGLAIINSHFRGKMRMASALTIMNYLNIASKNNILVKDGRSLELLNEVDTIVFDKTGTLTEERPTVGRIHGCSHYSQDEILRYAVAAEYKQTHPIAKAIIQEGKRRDLQIPLIDEAEYKVGFGLKVRVDGQTVRVGSKRFMESVLIPIPNKMQEIEKKSHQQGHSLVMVALDEQLIGAIELLPTIRSEAKSVIDALRRRPKIKSTYIISGDHEYPTRKLATELGIDHYFAETLPKNKADLIEKLQKEGRHVCYIGDGINDSIALKKAHVSISLRGASTVATDTAQIILLDQGLTHLNLLFDISQRFTTNMSLTILLSVAPTVICIGGAFLFGFGLAHSVGLHVVAFVGGLGSAMIPVVIDPTGKQRSLDYLRKQTGQFRQLTLSGQQP